MWNLACLRGECTRYGGQQIDDADDQTGHGASHEQNGAEGYGQDKEELVDLSICVVNTMFFVLFQDFIVFYFKLACFAVLLVVRRQFIYLFPRLLYDYVGFSVSVCDRVICICLCRVRNQNGY